METIACPLCGSKESSLFVETVDIKNTREQFKVVECSHCSFKYTNPRPTFDEIGKYYGTDYYSYQKPVAQSISINTDGKRFLDYGCGAGHVLLQKAELGYHAFGIEIDDTAIKTGKEMGFNIKKADPNKIDFPDDYFDNIHINHVLEHIHNLQTIMSEFYRCLKTGGQMWIEVPNVDSYDAKIHGAAWSYWYVPLHLYHFNTKSIENVLKRGGFTKFEIKTATVPAFNKKLDYLKSRYTTLKMKMALSNTPRLPRLITSLAFVGFNFLRYCTHKKKDLDGNLIQVIATK